MLCSLRMAGLCVHVCGKVWCLMCLIDELIYCGECQFDLRFQVQSNHWTVRSINREEANKNYKRNELTTTTTSGKYDFAIDCANVYEFLIDGQIECTRKIRTNEKKKMEWIGDGEKKIWEKQTNWWKNQFDPFSRMSIFYSRFVIVHILHTPQKILKYSSLLLTARRAPMKKKKRREKKNSDEMHRAHTAHTAHTHSFTHRNTQ